MNPLHPDDVAEAHANDDDPGGDRRAEQPPEDDGVPELRDDVHFDTEEPF